MFTQCSKCETVFRLSAQSLRAAGGQVRCGRCGEIFNALQRLAEDASGFETGESPLELEARADEILHSLEPLAAAGARSETSGTAAPQDDPAVAAPRTDRTPVEPPPASSGSMRHAAAGDEPDFAKLEFMNALDEDLTLDASLEFTLPPGELDRIFVETAPTALQRLTSSPPPAAAPTAPAREAPAAAAERAQPTAGAAPVTALRAAPPPAPASGAPASGARVVGLEVSDTARSALLAESAPAAPAAPAFLEPPRRALPIAVWIALAMVLAGLLAAQLIDANRQWRASSAPDLSGYQLRQWGVTGDPAAQGTLRVRASIMNVGDHLQPYPLLRVTLANRFGTRLGQREFQPAEYMGKPMAQMLSPGQRVDATLDIQDPGNEAEGFEIDVCLRTAAGALHCAADAPPAAAK